MSAYKPNQTDLQIIAQNVSTQASSLLVAALGEQEVALDALADSHAELTGFLMANVLAEIEARIEKYGASPKASGRGKSSDSSRSRGSSSSASRSSRGSGSSKSGGGSSTKATAKQVQFGLDLLEARVHDYNYEEDDLAKMSRKEISDLIEELKDADELE